MSVLTQRKALEDRMLSRLGFIIRTFQEDNNVTGSWGYTVGLKVNEQPYCLFVRIPVEVDLLDGLLSDTAAMVQMTGVPPLPFFLDNFETKDNKRLRFRIRRMHEDIPAILKDNFNIHIEGQDPDTKFNWLLVADENNILPGEEGYIDFKQLTFPESPTDPLKDDALTLEFDTEN